MMFPSTDNKHKVQTPPVQLMRTNFTPELQQHTDWTDVVTQLLSLPLHELIQQLWKEITALVGLY